MNNSPHFLEAFSCGFEYSLCGMSFDSSARLMFDLNQGGTGTAGTGPSDTPDKSSSYIYLETSNIPGRDKGDAAR